MKQPDSTPKSLYCRFVGHDWDVVVIESGIKTGNKQTGLFVPEMRATCERCGMTLTEYDYLAKRMHSHYQFPTQELTPEQLELVRGENE